MEKLHPRQLFLSSDRMNLDPNRVSTIVGFVRKIRKELSYSKVLVAVVDQLKEEKNVSYFELFAYGKTKTILDKIVDVDTLIISTCQINSKMSNSTISYLFEIRSFSAYNGISDINSIPLPSWIDRGKIIDDDIAF